MQIFQGRSKNQEAPATDAKYGLGQHIRKFYLKQKSLLLTEQAFLF